MLKPKVRPARNLVQWMALLLTYTILVFLTGAFVYSRFLITETSWQTCRDLGISTLSTISPSHNSKYTPVVEHGPASKGTFFVRKWVLVH
jgi:hypothetical protein